MSATDYWADDDLGDWLSTNRGINRVQHQTWFLTCWRWSGFGRSRNSSPDSFCIPMVPNLWWHYLQNLVFFSFCDMWTYFSYVSYFAYQFIHVYFCLCPGTDHYRFGSLRYFLRYPQINKDYILDSEEICMSSNGPSTTTLNNQFPPIGSWCVTWA